MALNTSMNILLVDDMTTMRKIQKKMLEKMGFKKIIEANDGKPAWDLLEEQTNIGEPIEFVISDWNMPGMTGLDLLKKCRADDRFKALPFLMVTAEAEQKNVVEAVKCGVSNYVVKPFSEDTLKAKIAAIFNE